MIKIKSISLVSRGIKTVFLVVLNTFVLYAAGAIIFSLLGTHPPAQNCMSVKEIYISTNGVHLDIILPVYEINYNLLNQLDISANTRFVAFGWGDKQFYINTPEWKDLTFPIAFKALFLKSETAMHVTHYKQGYPSWNRIVICPQQMETLNRYILKSFAREENGNILKIPITGYGDNDTFYNATRSFSLFRTCNVWVNNALKEAGIRTAVWSPFDVGVLYHIKKMPK
jgi:uncharacterized protein (TIGR02117 family)